MRTIFFINAIHILTVSALILISPIAASKAPADTSLDISITGKNINIIANNISLDEILTAISQAAPFKLYLKGNLSDPRTASFKNIAIDKAIVKLAGDNAVIITYSKNTSHAPTTLDEVRVYSNYDPGKLQQTDNLYPLDSISKLKLSDTLTNLKKDEVISFLQQNFTAEHLSLPERIGAAELLSEIGNLDAIKSLALGLNSPKQEIRDKTIELMGSIDDLHASLVLAQITFGSPDSQQRILALRALAKHDPANTLIFIQRAMNTDQQTSIRNEARRLLEQLSNRPNKRLSE